MLGLFESLVERVSDSANRQIAVAAYMRVWDSLKREADLDFIGNTVLVDGYHLFPPGSPGYAVRYLFRQKTSRDNFLGFYQGSKDGKMRPSLTLVFSPPPGESDFIEWFLVNAGDLLKQRREIFVHEFLHHLDKLQGSGLGNSPDNDDVAYYNSTHEMQAYFGQFYDVLHQEIELTLDTWKTVGRHFPSNQKLYGMLFGASFQDFLKNYVPNKYRNFDHFLSFLTPGNRQRILKRLAGVYEAAKAEVSKWLKDNPEYSRGQ